MYYMRLIALPIRIVLLRLRTGFPQSVVGFSSFLSQPTTSLHIIIKDIQASIQDALNTTTRQRLPVLSVAPVKIQSPQQQSTNSTHPFTPALPSQVELNFNEAIPSSRTSSFPPATFSPRDFLVFNTDSQQSTWLPSSSPSLPASSAQQQPSQPPQQDFVLFDQPARTNVNRTASSPATAAASFGSLNNRRHSSHNTSGSPALQNHRVAHIIQATGHQTSSSAFTNRFNSPAQNQQQQQFYASLSAPSSSVALNQQNRAARPPVPLFAQGIGSRTSGKMDLQGKSSTTAPAVYLETKRSHKSDAMSSFEDLSAFEGGASTTAYSSPAVPTYDVNVSSASSSTTNIGTVSPQDLLIREPFSAPNSSAFTNLTSPSIYNESPEFHDSFDISPNFGSDDFNGGSNDPWFPLFPQENTVTEHIPALDNSPDQQSDDLDMVETTSQPRRKSGNSPATGGHGRHSSVSGVNSRRRDKPLPPIVIDDPLDTIAMKRARNTLAARKSRERKAQRFEDLEEKIAKLEAERDHWKRIALSRTGGS
ncbi:cross-pathway control 1 [Xylariales sp. AK1849]|nr:cross-pathway control 1 [Xylariales sp. AK1849]